MLYLVYSTLLFFPALNSCVGLAQLSDPLELLPVFNLSRTLHCVSFEPYPLISLLPSEWTLVPKELALSYCINQPQLMVDLGKRSISELMCPYREGAKRALNFTGVVDVVTGYGNASAQLLRELVANDDLSLSMARSGYWHTDYVDAKVQALMEAAYPEEQPPSFDDTPNWLTHPTELRLSRTEYPPRWSIALTIPPELRKVPSPRKLLYTMWECDTIPQRANYLLTGNPDAMPKLWYHDPNAWPEWIEQYADVLAVPCQVQKCVFEKSCGKEAHVVPLGVNQTIQYTPRRRARTHYLSKKQEPRDKFVMLVYGELSARKGTPDVLLEVVWPVLHDKENWQLIFKTRGNKHSLLASVSDERVTIIYSDYTPEQMARLTQYADCGIALSRYEGWGMPFREMMAAGLPVIVANNSGHVEDCDEDYNYPVPSNGMSPTLQFYGQWYEPDWSVAQAWLRLEYADWQARGRTQSPMGERAAQWIRERRSWSTTADKLLGLVENNEFRNGRITS